MAPVYQEQLNQLLQALQGGEAEALDGIYFLIGGRMLALVLRQSEYRGSASLENVLARLNGLESYLAQDEYKQEFKQIVSLAEESGLYDARSDQEDMPVA